MNYIYHSWDCFSCSFDEWEAKAMMENKKKTLGCKKIDSDEGDVLWWKTKEMVGGRHGEVLFSCLFMLLDQKQDINKNVWELVKDSDSFSLCWPPYLYSDTIPASTD